MIWGIDYPGGSRFKSTIIKYHPRGWPMAVFDDDETFDDAMPLVKEATAKGIRPIFSIGMKWEDDHVYGDSHIPGLIKKAKKWEAFQKANPQIKIWLRPFVEHKLKNPDKYNDIVRENAPSCGLINSPLASGALSKKYWNEFHGEDKRPRSGSTSYTFSFDGKNCVDADIETFKKSFKDAQVFFFWNCQANGRMKEDDKTPRPQRKAWPTKEQIESWAYLSTDKGKTKPPADSVPKSHADQHLAKPEPRAGKPVLIISDKGPSITCKAGSKILATYKKGPVFTENRPGKPKRYIYRIESDYGYKISEQARKLTGSPLVTLSCGGTLNLAFRDLVYR